MKVSRKRRARREDGRHRQCLFILDSLHGSGVWRPLTMHVPGSVTPKSSQLKINQGTVTEYLRDLGGSPNKVYRLQSLFCCGNINPGA
jgi:hypothetical protein